MALYYWNGAEWVQESSSVAHVEDNIVIATPSRFSRWTVLGETKRVYLPLLRKTY